MRTLKSIFFLAIIALTLFNSCLDDYDEKTDKVEYVNLFIEPKIVTVIGMEDRDVNNIVVNESGKSYTLPLKWIEGFEYEEGFEYKIRCRKVTPANPIQDAPQSFYYLIEIISKDKILL